MSGVNTEVDGVAPQDAHFCGPPQDVHVDALGVASSHASEAAVLNQQLSGITPSKPAVTTTLDESSAGRLQMLQGNTE